MDALTAGRATSAPDADLRTDRVRHPLVVRRLAVDRVEDVGAGLRRVVLRGPDLEGFAALGPTDHVKLFVPPLPGAALQLPTVRDGAWVDRADPRLTYREITVRTWTPGSTELALEVVAGGHGPVGRWATVAQPGAEVAVLGPKSSTLRPVDRDRYVFAVDETGLPALRNWLDVLPASAQVTVLAEVGAAVAEAPLPSRASVEVTWLRRTTASGTPLADAVDDLLARPGSAARDAWWWAAAEAGQVRRMRAAVTSAGLPREHWSMTAYWRRGAAHFDHKAA